MGKKVSVKIVSTPRNLRLEHYQKIAKRRKVVRRQPRPWVKYANRGHVGGPITPEQRHRLSLFRSWWGIQEEDNRP
jgi:hypothetical protein